MPRKISTCIFLLISFATLLAGAALPKYPMISEWSGQAWVTSKDGKRTQIKAKQTIRDKALFETSLSGYVKVQLDEIRTFTVLSGSEVSIPVISLERGEAPILILKSGSFRWQQSDKTKASYNVALRSDLFEFLAPAGDYIFTMEPSRAFAGVKVISGSMEFSALNGEESAQVQAGQQVGFQGVLEGKEIAYDVLLQGKKIPRGKLTPVIPLEKKEASQFADEEKAHQKKEKARAAAEQKRLESIRKEGRICVDPPAKFNECAWICVGNPKNEKKHCLTQKEGVSCVRRRCNANGDWADETVLDAEKGGSICTPKAVVAPCDY